MTSTLYYFTLQDEQRRDEKPDWFRVAKQYWIDKVDNDFESLLQLVNSRLQGASDRFADAGLYRKCADHGDYRRNVGGRWR